MTGDRAQVGAERDEVDGNVPDRCARVDVHEHDDVTGIDKAGVKARIRELKQKRHDALEAHDYAALHSVRRELHRLNHRLRANMH